MSTQDLERQISELKTKLDSLQCPSQASHVSAVSVKLPPFWADKPTTWFGLVEAQFHIAGITQDITKYSHVISMLDTRVADEIEDIIASPPKENKYECLKAELTKRLSTSREQRIRQLLSEEQLGDRKPSQFLRHLRSLAGDVLPNDDFLRELWLRRLPQSVQVILTAQVDLPLSKVAEIADKVMEVAPPIMGSVVDAVEANTPTLTSLVQRIDALAEKVEALRSSNSSIQRGQSSSKSPERVNKRLCRFHKRFGEKAHRCISPCSWEENVNKAKN
ncbi:uncharacterized protein LOC135080964 [Ostrinia nubilalis]|uniref:uncharacterized protein LOC135080964 n=1 Tax=Ostrinia nubilalis TaxID=29057 RepID=UPI0030825305